MTPEIDREVIKRLSEGDQSAFRVVFEHYYPRVFEFIRRIVKSDVIAEDVAQDVFVKVWERREMFGVEVQAFGGYIYIMSRNAALNAIRQICRISPLVEPLIPPPCRVVGRTLLCSGTGTYNPSGGMPYAGAAPSCV